MLKKLVNEAYCVLRITTTGPILIKSGYATVSGPDMTPVRTYRNGRLELFLPGSSLKGVFRSHLEKIVCSLAPQVVCNPFLKKKRNEQPTTLEEEALHVYRHSCGDEFEKRIEADKTLADRTDVFYRDSCPTCRLFGSTSFIGRMAISDAYIVGRVKIGEGDQQEGAQEDYQKVEQRNGVGIDRLTGGSSHGALFDLEVVPGGTVFEAEIHLRNFECWQLGMFFVVVQDMADQLIRIGSGRSRGLGKVTATIDELERGWHLGGLTTSTMYGSQERDQQLWGLGCWLGDEQRYGTTKEDFLEFSEHVPSRSQGIRNLRSFKGTALETLQEKAIAQFVTRMQHWKEYASASAKVSGPVSSTTPQQEV
jgi:CRISPR-associated RAMP protein (TIGR02581 family)